MVFKTIPEEYRQCRRLMGSPAARHAHQADDGQATAQISSSLSASTFTAAAWLMKSSRSNTVLIP